MTSPRAPVPVHTQPLTIFLERIRKTFSHDLRTPLSTIVNYASILESHECTGAEEVRDLGRRIRGNALRSARMIELLANATALASRPLRASITDLAALARSVLVDTGGRGDVHLGSGTTTAVARLDAEVLGYAWRAFISVEADAIAGPVHEIGVDVHSAGADWVIELRCGGSNRLLSSAPPPALIEAPIYLRHNGGSARLETSMGFGLAQDLVVCHGGELGVWGRPGATSGLRLRLPNAA